MNSFHLLTLFLRAAFTVALCLGSAHANDVTVIDVAAAPWDTEPRFHSKTKTFFKGPNDSGFIYAEFAPRWDMTPPGDPLGPHYHLWHEWAYVLEGDFVIHEPVRAFQKSPMLSHFRQGTWLDRPAYTLHGGQWEIGGLRSQNACTLIIFEEGDGSVVTLGPKGDHFKPDFPNSKPNPYDPDWEKVTQFPHPWIVHSATDLAWESDSELPGRMVKWLSDDLKEGFRGQLIRVPPGWQAPATQRATRFTSANRFLYVIYGHITIETSDGSKKVVRKDGFIHQAPGDVLRFGPGAVTDEGAQWLEVTYAKGMAVGGGPIEAPAYMK